MTSTSRTAGALIAAGGAMTLAMTLAITLAMAVPAAAASPEYPPPAFGGGTVSGVDSGVTTIEPRVGAGLPSTGRDLSSVVALGLLGVAAGGATLLAVRRRTPGAR